MNAKRWIAITALLLCLIPLTGAHAHGYIVRAIPEDRAVLDRAPVRVQYWFSEALERDFSAITIRDATGNTVATGGVDERDSTLLSARLPTNLPDETYLSELTIAFSSDGHLIYETRAFFVGVAASDLASGGASTLPVPLEIVWRALLLSSSTLLLGIFVLYALVLVPAWGNPAYSAGLLPPRVMARLNVIVTASLIVAFSGNILALLQQSMTFFNADVTRVLSEGLWNIVRIGTRFGDMWNGRMALLILVAALFAASLYFRKEYPGYVRAFWTANTWAMALVFGTFSASSHAAGSITLAWVALASDWLHGLASGFWAGGVAALALMLPSALGTLEGDTKRKALLAVLNRFSPIAAGAVIIVIATGIYNALNWFTEPNDVATTYGAALALKLILVALLIGIAGLHHIALRPTQYARFSTLIDRMPGSLPALRLEAVLVIVILIAVGALAATPVPTPDLVGQTTPAPNESAVLGDYAVTMTITPGGPGVNTYDVLITDANEQPIEDLTIALRMTDPALDWRGAWHIMEHVGGGLYVSAGDEINTTGEWWTLIQVEGEQLPLTWQISQDAAVLQSRPPSILNLLALLGVILAVVVAIMPLIRWFIAWLDWSPVAVTVAVAASAATIGLIVLTAALIEQSSAQYQRAINPPPMVVNPVLPTQDSLMRGRDLVTSCAWVESNDLLALVDRLSHTRDEELFNITLEGWRDLTACSAALDELQRWDIVNYIRSLELKE